MHRSYSSLAAFLLLITLTQAVSGEELSVLAQQRADFLAAETALAQGATSRFHKLYAQLSAYPLQPYLRYQYLDKYLSRVSAEKISEFMTTYADTPLAPRLQYQWQRSLARHQRWQQLIDVYQPSSSVEAECDYRWALLKTGKQEQAFADMEQIWLVGRSQARACDRVFDAWNTAGLLTTDLVWNRIALAMDRRQITLARYLTRYLDAKEQRWAETWISVHRNPQLILSRKRFSTAHPMRNAILVHGIKRLAQKDPMQAITTWNETLRPQYPFTEAEEAQVERYLAMILAIRGKTEAVSWLAVVDEQADDKSLREWRVRAALYQGNWDAALAWLNQLNEEERLSDRWQYWQARSLEASDQHQQAEEIYITLAQNRSYYGFLSADRLNLPYCFEQQAIIVPETAADDIEKIPGIQRAKELFLLERIVDARREWYYATQSMSEDQLRIAAKVANDWGWYDRAILTIAQTDHRDDLELRFPLAHEKEIVTVAEQQGIDPALAFALIRQESAFVPDARSHAGALGLMQLMPRTARQIADRSDINLNNKYELLDVDTNLQFGMRYLRKVLSHFNENPVLATAAYNAGQYRVKKWIPDGMTPSDIWAETVPIPETRDYVQNILAYTVVYEQRMGKKPTLLSERMPPILSPEKALAKNDRPLKTNPME